uniref:Uncharacterized protein n=1 Tax=Romanomermis culicivorax TaxID=13658 RepID=A0A915HYG6_ROMCU
MKFGAKMFCDMALSHFPVQNRQLFSLVQPQPCTYVASTPTRMDMCADARNANFKLPGPVDLVYYKQNDKTRKFYPTACYFPRQHMDIRDANIIGNCMDFETAQEILSKKNPNDESRSQIKLFYMANLLRFHTKTLAPYDFEPNADRFYTFNRLRSETIKQSYRKILKDIEVALGYENSPNKRDFKGIDDKFDAQAGDPIHLSPHAFCAAIVEMIPFKQATIRENLKSCDEEDYGDEGNDNYYDNN